MTKKRIHIIISGRVQGVFFRAGTKRQAKILNITGWVKNNPDRTVEIIAEGEETNLKQLISWCSKGPLIARVDDIKIEWQKYKKEFEYFSIRY
ncbi:acylphosphatase [Candidatus Woesearchaeota archaeon]|nr:acylphosphatase [Candidatus Woesearchaeota archaeon]